MQQTWPLGNGRTTDSDSATVDTTAPTPTKVPEPAPEPDEAPTPAEARATTPDAAQFPPTLVGLDPPTLPAADGMKPPHRDVDARGPADLPQFRPFPHPQRSEPGHPGLRRMWRRLLTFWRRTTI